MGLLSRRRVLKQTGLGAMGLGLSLFGCHRDSPANPSPETSADVIVIGAGIAGLAAAQDLQAQGFRVLVLEGRDRIGGRIWTERSLGVPMDMGASWIHGPDGDNPITAIARAAGAKLFVTDDDSVELYDTAGEAISEADFDAGEVAYEDLLKRIEAFAENQSRDLSVASAIQRVAPQALQNPLLRYQLTAYMEFDAGGPIEELSAWYWNHDRVYPGLDVLFPDGYDSVPKALGRNLSIALNQNVLAVSLDTDGVTVKTQTGEFQAQVAVVTLPLGVLQTGTVQFEPGLPAEMQLAMGRLKMGTINKVALAYPQAFWDEELQYFGYTDPEKGRYSYFINARTFSPANALMTFGFGNYGLTLEGQTDTAIVGNIQNTLKTIFGSSIPEPEGILVSRWTADPWAKGAYSYAAVGSTPADFDTLGQTVANRLFFAGEHTISDYRGTVHGAYISGIRAANQATGQLQRG